MPNEPDALAGVSKLVGERGVNVAGSFPSLARRFTHRKILLRLERTDLSGMVKAISSTGYRAYAVEPSSPLSTSHEEYWSRQWLAVCSRRR